MQLKCEPPKLLKNLGGSLYNCMIIFVVNQFV